MGMSVAILSTIILFLIVFHAVALSAYHFHRLKQLQQQQQQQQQGNQGTKFTMGEKGQKILQ
jgi:flagellar basal body-associated protein FliL